MTTSHAMRSFLACSACLQLSQVYQRHVWADARPVPGAMAICAVVAAEALAKCRLAYALPASWPSPRAARMKVGGPRGVLGQCATAGLVTMMTGACWRAASKPVVREPVCAAGLLQWRRRFCTHARTSHTHARTHTRAMTHTHTPLPHTNTQHAPRRTTSARHAAQGTCQAGHTLHARRPIRHPLSWGCLMPDDVRGECGGPPDKWSVLRAVPCRARPGLWKQQRAPTLWSGSGCHRSGARRSCL
jgi:hypothetical protein